MAQKKEETAKPIDTKVDLDSCIQDFMTSDRWVSKKREGWDEKEKLFLAEPADDISEDETKSQVVDPRLSTMLIERAARVTAQLPKGKAYALDKQDRGKNSLMNTIVDKWIYPNAKKQFPFLTKLRMMDLYSLIYGSYFGLVDWVVDKRSGYIGPDFYLLDIRDVFPQAGATSIIDSDYINISTLKTAKWLEAFNPEFYAKIKDKIPQGKSTGRSSMSKERISTRYNNLYMGENENSKNNPYLEIITRYERDKWVTWSPDFPKEVIRVIESPHKNIHGKPNGELPIVTKYCFPLLDDFFGLSEIERPATLQKALGSLINLYLDGVKMSLFPPLQINNDEVVSSTIKMRAGAKWLVDRPNQSVQPTQLSPQGLNTFTSTYQYLLSALQFSMGTSTTEIGEGIDMTQGKTPQALKMQSGRENTWDNWDRQMMEDTTADLMEKMINLQACKMSTPLVLTTFKSTIVDIAKDYPDVVELFQSEERGRVKIQPEYVKAKYNYEIERGSMYKKDDALELANLNALMGTALQGLAQDKTTGQVTSPLLEALKTSERPRTIDYGELLGAWVNKSGLQNSDKILVDQTTKNKMSPEELALQASELDKQLAGLEGELTGQPMGQSNQQPMQQAQPVAQQNYGQPSNRTQF